MSESARSKTQATNPVYTVEGDARLQQEVRKSRFVAQATRVEDVDTALAFFSRLGARDATHNCWAYRIGAQYRFNDDGEPGGSAGRPILLAIDGQRMDHVAVVVTRWFGGVKLGVGGLARAYGGCAAECLRLGAKQELIERVRARVRCDFSTASQLYARLREFDAIRQAEHASDDAVRVEVDLPQSQLSALAALVRDLTRGRGSVELSP